MARALERAAASETGTLRYDWYRSTNPAVFVVEEYVDPPAVLAHNEHRASLLGRVAELAEITSVQLHGDLGPELEDWVARHDGAAAHPPLH